MARKNARILACQIVLKKSGESFNQRERRVLPARTGFAIELPASRPQHVYVASINDDKDSVRVLLSSEDAADGLRIPAAPAWLSLSERSYAVAVGSAEPMSQEEVIEFLGGRAPDRQQTGGRTTRG